MVHVVYVLDARVEVDVVQKLDFVKNLHTYLRLHNSDGFFVCNLASDEKVGLLQLLQEFAEGQTVNTELLDLSQH